MPLSINKLISLVQAKGYVPYQYFTIDYVCVYMTVMCLKTADLFLMYFPSSYKIEIPFTDNVYKLRYIDLKERESITEEYAGPAEEEVDMSIQLSPDKKAKMEEHLENHYNQPIDLKDITKDDLTDLQGIYRQLKRLRNCVHHIRYKVGVFFKNYLCTIHRDGTIDSYYIKHYPIKRSKNLLVVLDLELFYDKVDRLERDLQTVRNGIYKVLERNHIFHSQIMEKMITSKQDSDKIASETMRKKEKYSTYIKQLEQMLSGLSLSEEKRIKELTKLSSGEDTLNDDITRTHRKSQLDRELDHIQSLKQDIIKHLLWTKEKREHTLLSIDKIMFDNTVMFDCIVKNFVKLNNFR